MSVYRKIGSMLIATCLVMIFELSTGWVRAFNAQLDLIVMFVKYLILTLLILKYRSRYFRIYIIGFALFWGVLGLVMPLYTFFTKGHLKDFLAFPNILSAITGVVSGFAIFRNKNNKSVRVLLVLVPLALCTFFYFNHSYYYDFIFHTTLDAKKYIDEKKEVFELTDRQANKLNLDKDKYIVMDFWNTQCMICFEKFPAFEKLYEQYKDHPELQFYAVNKPLRSDTFDIFKRTEKYTFPSVRGSGNIAEVFDVRGYPTVVIVKGNRILHSGSVESVEKYIRKHVR